MLQRTHGWERTSVLFQSDLNAFQVLGNTQLLLTVLCWLSNIQTNTVPILIRRLQLLSLKPLHCLNEGVKTTTTNVTYCVCAGALTKCCWQILLIDGAHMETNKLKPHTWIRSCVCQLGCCMCIPTATTLPIKFWTAAARMSLSKWQVDSLATSLTQGKT